MVKYLQDWMFRFLQKRCRHPGEMVAADLLEGNVDHIQIRYCRRCGAVKVEWSPRPIIGVVRTRFYGAENE